MRIVHKTALAIGLAMLGGLAALPASAQSPQAGLPGGATSLNETHADWQVGCVSQATRNYCAMSQVQVRQQGERVLAIELQAPADNTVAGTLLLPFGLALSRGVTLQIDDKSVSEPKSIRTCLPAGCVVPLSFDSKALLALRAGTTLKLKAISDDGTEVPFSISLAGFGAALDRAGALAK